MLNARTDAFVRGGDRPVRESIDDAVTRGRAYLDAGADLVFVPGVLSADVTRALVDGIGERKVSVIGLPGALTAGEYEALGVARISYGPMTQRVALTALQDVASELYSDGVVPRARAHSTEARVRAGSCVALDGPGILAMVVGAPGGELGPLRLPREEEHARDESAPDDDDGEDEEGDGDGGHRASFRRARRVVAEASSTGGHAVKSSGRLFHGTSGRTTAATTRRSTVPQPTTARYSPGYPS